MNAVKALWPDRNKPQFSRLLLTGSCTGCPLLISTQGPTASPPYTHSSCLDTSYLWQGIR